MKEYKINILGVEDFVIISPKVVGMLLQKIRESENTSFEIPVESIMPPGYTQYLINVLNSNRGKKQFKFYQIKEKQISSEHIYQIMEYQMKNLKVETRDCFEKVILQDMELGKNKEYSIETEDLFFCICKNENSKLTYQYLNGKQESIVLECMTVNE